MAIDPVATADGFSLYPNPATNSITVGTPCATAVNIYDMAGRIVLTMQTRAGNNTIDISALPQGVYFLKTASHTAKLVKK